MVRSALLSKASPRSRWSPAESRTVRRRRAPNTLGLLSLAVVIASTTACTEPIPGGAADRPDESAFTISDADSAVEALAGETTTLGVMPDAPVAATGEPIRLGMINQDTGAVGAFPELTLAAQAAVDFVNAELGGIDGRPLELLTCDTGFSPEGSTACAQRLVSEGVVAVTGGIDVWGASIPVLESNEIPYIGGIPVSDAELRSPISFLFSGGSPGCVRRVRRLRRRGAGGRAHRAHVRRLRLDQGGGRALRRRRGGEPGARPRRHRARAVPGHRGRPPPAPDRGGRRRARRHHRRGRRRRLRPADEGRGGSGRRRRPVPGGGVRRAPDPRRRRAGGGGPVVQRRGAGVPRPRGGRGDPPPQRQPALRRGARPAQRRARPRVGRHDRLPRRDEHRRAHARDRGRPGDVRRRWSTPCAPPATTRASPATTTRATAPRSPRCRRCAPRSRSSPTTTATSSARPATAGSTCPPSSPAWIPRRPAAPGRGEAGVDEYLRFLLLGLGSGAVVAVLGLGLVLTQRASGVLNLAHAAMGMFGAATFFQMRETGELVLPVPGLPDRIRVAAEGMRPTFATALVIALVLAAVVGALVDVAVFARLRRAPALARVVASLGLMLFLLAMAQARFEQGAAVLSIESVLPDRQRRRAGRRHPARPAAARRPRRRGRRGARGRLPVHPLRPRHAGRGGQRDRGAADRPLARPARRGQLGDRLGAGRRSPPSSSPRSPAWRPPPSPC